MNFLEKIKEKINKPCVILLVSVLFIKVALLTVIYFNTNTTLTQSCGVTHQERITTEMESFYITLPSNVKSFENSNIIGNYTTNLDKGYNLPNHENWEVGIAEVSYGKNWYNIRKRQYINLFSISPNISNQKITLVENMTSFLEPGLYAKPKSLVKKINDILKSKFGKSIKTVPQLHLNRFNQKIYYTLGEDNGDLFYIQLDSDLSRILGLEENGKTLYETISTHGRFPRQLTKSYKLKRIYGNRPVDLYAGYHTLYVYCDLVDYSVIGNSYQQLLRALEVPTNKDFGDQVVLTYTNPIYVPLLKNEFQSIEIDIKDETGKSLEFEFGRVIVVLHFRKKNG